METNRDDMCNETIATCYDAVMDDLQQLYWRHGEDVCSELGQSVGSVIDALLRVRNAYVWKLPAVQGD